VIFSGFSLDGADANNYTLSAQPSGTANITAKSLTITGISAASKEYDGNTIATVTGAADASGVISGDMVTIIDGTATFNNKNVGTDKTVTFANFKLSGADAGNYTPIQPASVIANITAKPLTITGVTANSREYNGSTTVELTGGKLNGIENGDNVNFTRGIGTIATPDIGTNKAVSTNITLTGTDASNYTLTQPTDITVEIKSSQTPIFSNRENPLIGRIGVQTKGNAILLSNLPQSATVEVYNLKGKLIFTSGKSVNRGSDNLQIQVQTGIYIVKIGTQTIRVAVR